MSDNTGIRHVSQKQMIVPSNSSLSSPQIGGSMIWDSRLGEFFVSDGSSWSSVSKAGSVTWADSLEAGNVTDGTGTNNPTLTSTDFLQGIDADVGGDLNIRGGSGTTTEGAINITTTDNAAVANGGSINVTSGNSIAADGGPITITSGNGFNDGGLISLISGDGIDGSGGNIVLTGGDCPEWEGGLVLLNGGSSTTGQGGSIYVTAGPGDDGGYAFINGGAGTGGFAGGVTIKGGSSSDGLNHGNVLIEAGKGSGANSGSGDVRISTSCQTGVNPVGDIEFSLGRSTVTPPGRIIFGDGGVGAHVCSRGPVPAIVGATIAASSTDMAGRLTFAGVGAATITFANVMNAILVLVQLTTNTAGVFATYSAVSTTGFTVNATGATDVDYLVIGLL